MTAVSLPLRASAVPPGHAQHGLAGSSGLLPEDASPAADFASLLNALGASGAEAPVAVPLFGITAEEKFQASRPDDEALAITGENAPFDPSAILAQIIARNEGQASANPAVVAQIQASTSDIPGSAGNLSMPVRGNEPVNIPPGLEIALTAAHIPNGDPGKLPPAAQGNPDTAHFPASGISNAATAVPTATPPGDFATVIAAAAGSISESSSLPPSEPVPEHDLALTDAPGSLTPSDTRSDPGLARPAGQHQASSPHTERARLDVATPVRSPNWSAEVGQRVVWMVSNNIQEAQLSINPQNLGPIEITLSLNDDQATAHFASPYPEVREALEEALPRLREMLAGAGVQLGQSNVGAESQQASQQPANRHGSSASGHPNFGEEHPSLLPDNAVIQTATVHPFARNGLVDTFV